MATTPHKPPGLAVSGRQPSPVRWAVRAWPRPSAARVGAARSIPEWLAHPLGPQGTVPGEGEAGPRASLKIEWGHPAADAIAASFLTMETFLVPDAPQCLLVPTPVLGALLNITPRRVQQLAADGVIQSETHGQWDALKAVPAFIAHRLAQETARVSQRSGGANERHVTAKAKAVELKTARDEGVLCDTAEAVAVVEEVVGTIRAGFGGLAARVTRDLGLRAVIDGEIDNTLERASVILGRRATELRRGGEAVADPGEAEPEAAAESPAVASTRTRKARATR